MADDEVVDQKIEHPVKHEVSSSAGCVTEELLRHKVSEGRIEKIYYFGNYFR